VHFEGLAGLAPRSALRAIARCEVLVTLHDFTPWCPRPHLWEAPASRFCAFSRDEARCHACLRADFDVPRGFEREWRTRMADLLAAAAAIVFPSESLRSAWRDLLPRLDVGRQHVIEPGAIEADPVNVRPGGPVRHVALVGAVTAAKGATLLPEIVRAADGMRFTVLGGGDATLLRQLRRLPNTGVRGYYRAGSLPEHLSARRIDVALLLSLVPESYGLTLDECWQAGVPVVAFDHGAVAERIRRLGGGLLVPLEKRAAGVIETLRALHDRRIPLPPVPPRAVLATPEQAAGAHLGLYRRLGLLD
jgi:glycosyltransferase involved in cell wall biosynthesis